MSASEPTGGRSALADSRVVTLLLMAMMLLWVLAFVPDPWLIATLPGVIGLLILVERAPTTRRAMLLVACFGALGIGTGYHWLAQTVQDFGKQSPPAAYVLTALFGVIGTVHAFLFVPAYRALLRRGHRPHPMTVAAMIVAVETLPIRLFPWMVGHAAIDAPAVAQHAEWGGVPAVSFIVLCFAVSVYELLVWAWGATRSRARPAAAMFTLLVGVLAVGWGAYRNAQILDEEAAATASLKVGVVQANIGGEAKRKAENGDPSARRRSQEAYVQGSKEVLAAGVDLVVWPESAVTAAVPFHQAPGMIDDYIDQYLDQYLRRDKRHRFFHNHGTEAAFLIGSYEEYRTERSSPLSQAKGRSVDRYNTAAMRIPPKDKGKPQWSTVRKVYLIPFGEYLPFGLPEDQFLPQNFKMRAGADEQQPLVLGDLTLVPFLCYEGILPDYVRTLARGKRPDILVSLTNDSWFGDSWEPHQHLNFTRFRAIEHRTPMVRSTSTGISAFISATGRVEAQLGVGERGTLIRSVPLVDRGETLYVTQGHRLPLLLQIYSVIVLFLSQMRPPPAEVEDAA